MGKRMRENDAPSKEEPPNHPACASLPALPWMRKPLDIDSFPTLPLHQVAGLDTRLVSTLQSSGIEALFPVQVAVWQQTIGSCGRERDLCICSPTGSGKTLAYALPIVQMLSFRVIRRLRALIVLPTRDLAIQVIDESDRLLRQAYQDWLPHSLDRIFAKGQSKQLFLKGFGRGFSATNHHRAMKMVLSATLTRDPAKIEQIKLCFPVLISASVEDKRYQLPEQLRSFRLVSDADTKPLQLLALLQLLKDQKTIVFTASVTSTHRLFLLLKCFETQFKVVEYSSLQHQLGRSKALAAFRRGDVEVLVASDAMTRGMDVEGVMNVINYDVPVYAKTYVHRVGRTARAGKPGSSYTLLRKEEVRHFKEMLQKVDNSTCKRFKLPVPMVDELYLPYVEGLRKLKELTILEALQPPGSSLRESNDTDRSTTHPKRELEGALKVAQSR